ncbi:MAG: glycoside hydrolase family 31 protein [Lachnospiraceae bacterium]|nr:glycoside hydrolase family 31 protein [Lachnospiraceae bacterium]
MNYGKLKEYHLSGRKLFLQFAEQEAWIEAVTPEIINVFCGLDEPEHRSKAIEGDKTLPVEIRVEEKEDGLWMDTGNVRVRICDDFYVDFYDSEGREVCADYRGKRAPLERISEEHRKLLLSEGHARQEEKKNAFEVLKKLQGTEHFYGLGDKTGFLDKRHYEYEMWNTDDPSPHTDCYKALYKSIPFFITLTDTHVYGIFADNTCKGYFNMGQESEDYYWFGFEGGNLDYYYIAGDSMADVLSRYTALTGTCPLPQRWALGYHQSRWGYMNQEDVEYIADGMRDHDIPCDSIHLDIDYMQDYKVFTWNEGRYHGDAKACLERLAERGFKPVVINDPGVKKEAGYSIYEEGVENGYFAKTPEGDTYINAVWPGDAAFPDFGNPQVRAWWGRRQQFLLNQGVRGIWNDMNEPASFNGPLPDDVVFTDEDRESTHAKMHNVYGHLMAKAAYEGLKKLDGRRPFVITRACYAGSQKYALCWTGDNNSLWAHIQMAIPQLCNLGLSGMPFAGTDVGGFDSDTTPELLARWVQVGCFSPFFRNHSAMGTRRQEPWQFGPEILNIYRKYVKLRYRLIPYIYDLFYEEEKTGAPVMRPLVFHYEKDETARTCNDEFMLGSRILAAPVVMPGMTKRMVYLPEGTWYDYWTGEKTEGPAWMVKDAPLDTCPIYVKAGSIIPVMEEQSFVGEKPADTLILEVYPGAGSWEHYLDNGEDFAYRDGAYHQYHFTTDEDGRVTGSIVHAGYEKPYETIVARRHRSGQAPVTEQIRCERM